MLNTLLFIGNNIIHNLDLLIFSSIRYGKLYYIIVETISNTLYCIFIYFLYFFIQICIFMIKHILNEINIEIISCLILILFRLNILMLNLILLSQFLSFFLRSLFDLRIQSEGLLVDKKVLNFLICTLLKYKVHKERDEYFDYNEYLREVSDNVDVSFSDDMSLVVYPAFVMQYITQVETCQRLQF